VTPHQAMDDVHRAIGILADVRAWLMRHEADIATLSPVDAHRLASCQWTAWAAGEALAQTSNNIGRMDLKTFGGEK
jgi:hypothetical protein